MAAAAPPPSSRIVAAANWAEPAKVVADIATAPTGPIPASTARRPKEAPKRKGATASGSAARTPSRIRLSTSPNLAGAVTGAVVQPPPSSANRYGAVIAGQAAAPDEV